MPLTEQDFNYLFGAKSTVTVIPTPQEILNSIESTLKSFENWGLNPKKVSANDFEITTVAASDPHHGAAPARIYSIFKHNVTGRMDPFDVALMLNYGTYPTAVRLTQLAEKLEE